MNTFDFTGKKIFITGASSGIGYGIAEAFARAGGQIIVLANDDGITGAASNLQEFSTHAVHAIQADISDSKALGRAIGKIESIDILINNAGVALPVSIADTSDDAETNFRRVIEINLVGTYLVTREVLQKMPDGGRIIMTGSPVGRGRAMAGTSPYASSKAALQGLTQALAAELGPRNINVNTVCPGTTHVPWMEQPGLIYEIVKTAYPKFHQLGLLTEDNVVDLITIDMVIGQGLLKPEDLAPTYLHLASPGGASITGQCIHVDRGDIMR